MLFLFVSLTAPVTPVAEQDEGNDVEDGETVGNHLVKAGCITSSGYVGLPIMSWVQSDYHVIKSDKPSRNPV